MIAARKDAAKAHERVFDEEAAGDLTPRRAQDLQHHRFIDAAAMTGGDGPGQDQRAGGERRGRGDASPR